MGTRGTVRIGSNSFFIKSDAYPSFAREKLKKSAMAAKTTEQFVKIANALAGYNWISRKAYKKDLGWPFEEYRYIVGLRSGTVKGFEILDKNNKLRKV